MDFSRRDLLKFGAGAAALLATGTSVAWADEKKKPRIGLQLYSLRDIAPRDPVKIITEVGKMGYQGVEFAGYYNRSAKDLKKILDDAGLVCCGTHTGLDTLQGDKLKATIEFHKTLGNKYLIVPSLPGSYLKSVEACKKTAALFTEIAAKLKAEDMYTGYHAHGGDFRKIGDSTSWNLLFENAGPDVMMQLDTGNCLDGGGDPVAILKKFPGRSRTIHIKEHGGKRNAPVGEGKVPWKEVIEICQTTGGTDWFVIEQEAYDRAPLDAVKACIENFKKLVG